jgi:hypothetical protein
MAIPEGAIQAMRAGPLSAGLQLVVPVSSPATVLMIPWPRHGADAKATIAMNSTKRILTIPPETAQLNHTY